MSGVENAHEKTETKMTANPTFLTDIGHESSPLKTGITITYISIVLNYIYNSTELAELEIFRS